jgi:hypothetical protein
MLLKMDSSFQLMMFRKILNNEISKTLGYMLKIWETNIKQKQKLAPTQRYSRAKVNIPE